MTAAAVAARPGWPVGVFKARATGAAGQNLRRQPAPLSRPTPMATEAAAAAAVAAPAAAAAAGAAPPPPSGPLALLEAFLAVQEERAALYCQFTAAFRRYLSDRNEGSYKRAIESLTRAFASASARVRGVEAALRAPEAEGGAGRADLAAMLRAVQEGEARKLKWVGPPRAGGSSLSMPAFDHFGSKHAGASVRLQVLPAAPKATPQTERRCVLSRAPVPSPPPPQADRQLARAARRGDAPGRRVRGCGARPGPGLPFRGAAAARARGGGGRGLPGLRLQRQQRQRRRRRPARRWLRPGQRRQAGRRPRRRPPPPPWPRGRGRLRRRPPRRRVRS